MTTTVTSNEARAAAAYLRTYEGPWGSKASEEDALLSILHELWPDQFTNEAEGGIYKIRESNELEDLAVLLHDTASEGADEHQIVAAVLPRAVEILGEPAPAAAAIPSHVEDLDERSPELIEALRVHVAEAFGRDEIAAYSLHTGGGCFAAVVDLSIDARGLGRQIWLTREENWIIGLYDYELDREDEGVCLDLFIPERGGRDNPIVVATKVADILRRLGVTKLQGE